MRRSGHKYFLLAFLLILVFTSNALAQGRVKVKGYYRKDGTYVRPHYRTAPDGNPYNNYSFPGNYNPNTGETTPGNPETYLENYNNKKPSNSPSIYSLPSSQSRESFDAIEDDSSQELLENERKKLKETAEANSGVVNDSDAGHAQEDKAVKERIDEVFTILSRLEERIYSLEKELKSISALPEPAKRENTPAGLYLKRGMTKKAVLAILGAPTGTDNVSGYDYWFYPNGRRATIRNETL
jgi:hypothetical protein